jgi:hypothetical protein
LKVFQKQSQQATSHNQPNALHRSTSGDQFIDQIKAQSAIKHKGDPRFLMKASNSGNFKNGHFFLKHSVNSNDKQESKNPQISPSMGDTIKKSIDFSNLLRNATQSLASLDPNQRQNYNNQSPGS